ncbi:MAG: hypothetical protein ONB30_08550 [candidate division KSB1 bacterium]|nr:hypothetical protein [candidate division KSB1 bacterium]
MTGRSGLPLALLCSVVLIRVACVGVVPAGAQEDRFVTISTLKCRSLSMGGASVAVRDDLGAVNMNPAAIDLFATPQTLRFAVFFNPVAPAVAFCRSADLGTARNEQAIALAAFVKAIAVTLSPLDLVVSWGEEVPGFGPRQHGPEAFQLRHFADVFCSSGAVRLRLAPQVALGAGSTVWHLRQQGHSLWQAGFSYGVLVQPDPRVCVGAVYVELPDSFETARQPLERIGDESLNLGFAWHPFSSTMLSADLRSVGEEGSPLSRELHVGFEQIVFGHLALRGGAFREKESRSLVYSAGVGLFDTNAFVSAEKRLAHPAFAVNYALVYRAVSPGPVRWHLLSVLLRL